MQGIHEGWPYLLFFLDTSSFWDSKSISKSPKMSWIHCCFLQSAFHCVRFCVALTSRLPALLHFTLWRTGSFSCVPAMLTGCWYSSLTSPPAETKKGEDRVLFLLFINVTFCEPINHSLDGAGHEKSLRADFWNDELVARMVTIIDELVLSINKWTTDNHV